jgi:hypothetical protein
MNLVESEALIAEVRSARDRGVQWLLNHIGSNGKPVGADERNGWARVPWALAVSGESEAAARVIAWAVASQLADDGNFAVGPAFGTGRFGAYPLAHFAIGCWLTERFETAQRVMGALRAWQNKETGGFAIAPPFDAAQDLSDLLSTAQAGLAAVICGHDDVADLCWRWIRVLVELQPGDEGSLFFTFRRGPLLVSEPDQSLKWLAITDFSQPRQTFYTPGMAAVFLAAYAARRVEPSALQVASELLQFNLDGCSEQFDDPASVQACKFGWGASAMLVAQGTDVWDASVAKMGSWFVGNQGKDGSWAPSEFLVPNPSDIDRLVKTAEHVMEVNAILAALGTAQVRTAKLHPAA